MGNMLISELMENSSPFFSFFFLLFPFHFFSNVSLMFYNYPPHLFSVYVISMFILPLPLLLFPRPYNYLFSSPTTPTGAACLQGVGPEVFLPAMHLAL